jgi:transcriptional regulator with XRE-family HTH domain
MGTLGQNIVKARVDKRWKQKDLVEKAGLSQKYLSQIELDKVDPRVSVLVRIADALGVSTDSLLGHTVNPWSPEQELIAGYQAMAREDVTIAEEQLTAGAEALTCQS